MNKPKDTKKSCLNLELKYRNERERVNATQNMKEGTKMRKSTLGYKREKETKTRKRAMGTQNAYGSTKLQNPSRW